MTRGDRLFPTLPTGTFQTHMQTLCALGHLDFRLIGALHHCSVGGAS